MKALIALVLFLVVNIAYAEKPSPVIITDSIPIEITSENPVEVSLTLGEIVYVAPVPYVPAQIKRYSNITALSIRENGETIDYRIGSIVERDSIIKFVNTTNWVSWNTNPHGGGYCKVDVDIVFPPWDYPLSEIPPGRRIPLARSMSNTTNTAVNQQFATGGIFLPKGTLILDTLTAKGFNVCRVGSYGVLFEQD
jgi:hypothetical protein